ncbi:hypothetical protein JIN84_09260 [Luteolibacter yonseiensis]|uniref:Uncharacterized protein n=1 Tax=Luteolibacter yonseiensis TaxID=1144680 RepID=A0A934R2T1_9BACT|nr:hypothetical protein [Luteolibacter yonseiensis]MBK1815804.1 hypothetical protein [Luteolibacter yonseiensis]
MEPPPLNQVLTIGTPYGPDGPSIEGIVKKSGVDPQGRTWAHVWYNDVVAAYVGQVEWRDERWQFSDRTFETLHSEWRPAIDHSIALHRRSTAGV